MSLMLPQGMFHPAAMYGYQFQAMAAGFMSHPFTFGGMPGMMNPMTPMLFQNESLQQWGLGIVHFVESVMELSNEFSLILKKSFVNG